MNIYQNLIIKRGKNKQIKACGVECVCDVCACFPFHNLMGTEAPLDAQVAMVTAEVLCGGRGTVVT